MKQPRLDPKDILSGFNIEFQSVKHLSVLDDDPAGQAKLYENLKQQAHVKGLQDHYKMKNHWSWFLMLLMAGLITFQCILLRFTGNGEWNFKDYE